MYEILPNLFLSSFGDILDENSSNFFIVNCTKNLPMISNNNIRLSIDDNETKKSMDIMYNSFEKICDRIDIELSNNNKVIVHCLAGIQRSPTIICAYLMIKKQYQLQDAILYIKSKKNNIFFCKINFMASLQKLQLKIINNLIGIPFLNLYEEEKDDDWDDINDHYNYINTFYN